MSEGGRPTVFTPETLQKLDFAFSQGLSDREACLFANISPSGLYGYCKENPEYSERKELLKDEVKMVAKINIAKSIKEDKKEDTSRWYLERRDKGFNPKHEIDINAETV